MDLLCMWGDMCRATDFIHPPIHSTLYVHVTCSLVSPSKFHQPKPNKWCTHFVISTVSETAGHEKRCRSPGHDLWYYLLSTAYLFYTIQLTYKIPIIVLHCSNVVPKLFYPFSAIARNIHSTYKSEYVLPSVRNSQTGYTRDKEYMGTTEIRSTMFCNNSIGFCNKYVNDIVLCRFILNLLLSTTCNISHFFYIF